MPNSIESQPPSIDLVIQAERPIECPEGLPRKLIQLSPATSAIASVNTQDKFIEPMEITFHHADNILIDLLTQNDTSFQCHDCPLPDTQGCITNVKSLYIKHSQKPIPKKEQTKLIFGEISLIPTNIDSTIGAKLSNQTKTKLYEIAASNHPTPEPISLSDIDQTPSPTPEPTPVVAEEIEPEKNISPPPIDNRPIKIKLAEWQQEIAEYYRQHPEEANQPFDPKIIENIDLNF